MVKIINRFSKYKIYCDGTVVNSKGLKLQPTKSNSGYYYVTLYNEGVPIKYYVHRLVAEHFLEPSNLTKVNHKDCNKLNNNLSNLEWCSTSQNTQHAYDNCLIIKQKVSDNINTKDLYLLYKSGKTMLEVSKEFNIGITSVSKYINQYVNQNNIQNEFLNLKAYFRSLSNKRKYN